MTNLPSNIEKIRFELSSRYLQGHGIEVGALDAPFPITEEANIQYIDRLTKDDLLLQYPELFSRKELIKDPDLVDDGEVLMKIPSASQDFVIANHFLEHCENPLGTIRHHARVLNQGGRLFYAVPNGRNPHSWDFDRGLTTFEHLVEDDIKGPEVSRKQHFWEWVTYVGKITDEPYKANEIERLMQIGYSIHFHVWTHKTFFNFLDKAIEYNRLSLFVQHFECNDYETIAILQTY